MVILSTLISSFKKIVLLKSKFSFLASLQLSKGNHLRKLLKENIQTEIPVGEISVSFINFHHCYFVIT